MGISGGPNIIEDGLVLALDASSTYLPVNRNLLTYTNDLTNAAWAKVRSQITSSATIAPDGTNTAFAMTITDATGLVRLSQNSVSTSIPGGPYTFSVYVKQNNISASLFDTGIYNTATTSGSEPSYNILNNFVATGSNGNWVSNRTVTSIGNGWYRVATTATIPNNSTWYLFFDIEAGPGTKTNDQNLYLWGPQFEYGNIATEYQPVNTTTRIWLNQINSPVSGSLINNPAFDSSNGSGIAFDGIDDYIAGYSSLLGNTSTCSLEIVCKFSTLANYTTLLYLGNTSFNHNIPYVCFSSLFGSLYFSTNKSSGGSRLTYSAVSSITSNAWHHCVGTMGGGLLKLYIDGVYKSSYTLPVDYIADVSGQPIRMYGGTSYGAYTSGSISIARVYNKELSAQEVVQNYNQLKSRFNI